MKRLIVAAGIVFLAACGGGGGGSTSTPTPTGAAVSLASFKGVYYGTAAVGTQSAFSLAGSDLQGNSWTGSYATVSDGITTFEAQNVTSSRSMVTLQRGAGAPISSVSTRYFLTSDGSAYKAVTSLGMTSTPASQTALPTTAHVGDFGNFMITNNSDGTTTAVTWKLEPEFNGNSKLTFSSVVKTGTSVKGLEDDTLYLDPSGTPYKMAVTVTASGTTVTMTGARR